MKLLSGLLCMMLMFSGQAWGISYGSDVEEKEFPFAVWVKPKFSPNTTCTASIIASTWALTAAHCVMSGGQVYPPSVMQIGVSYNVHSAYPVDVKRIVVHPAYNNPAIYPDVALLELAESVRVEPISLLTLAQESQYVKPGTEVTLIGGGLTEDGTYPLVLRKARFTIREDCPLTRVSDTAMCINIDGRAKPEGGDSGGPLVVQFPNGQWGQVGIVKSAEGGGLAPLTRVAAVRDWISSLAVIKEATPEVFTDDFYFLEAKRLCLDPRWDWPDREPSTRCSLLPIIVQGGSWETEIEISNTHKSKEALYRLIFRSDHPRGLYVVGNHLEGWQRVIENSLQPLSTHTYTLSRDHSSVPIEAEALVYRQKASDLVTGGRGSLNINRDPYQHTLIKTIITQYVPNRAPFQTTLEPLKLRSNIGSNRFYGHSANRSYPYRYRNDGPYGTAVAMGSLLGWGTLALSDSSFGSDRKFMTYLATAYDKTGTRICTAEIHPTDRNASKSFLVKHLLPCTEGQKGFITFESKSTIDSIPGFVAIQTLGFHDQGPFFAY